MRHLLWNKPVFYTLLGIGFVELAFIILIGKDSITSVFQLVVPLTIGLIIGLIVSILEVFIFRKKRNGPYHPTKIPYTVMNIMLILNIVVYYLRFGIAIVFGAYLISLALSFGEYEMQTGQKRITWKELLTKQEVMPSSSDKVS